MLAARAGPCVIAGTPPRAEKLLPSSTNGLGPRGSGAPEIAWWQRWKAVDQRVARVEREGVADEHPVAVDRRAACRRRGGRAGPEVALDGVRIGPGQPSAGAFEPGLLGILIEDLARVDLADEDARRPADRMSRRAASSSSSRPSRATSSAAAAITLGSSGGPHDLVDRRSFAADDGLPRGRAPSGDRQDVAKRLGEQDGVAADALADQACRAGGRRPTGPRAGRGPSAGPTRPTGAPASRSARTASTAAAIPAFMSDAPLPVSRPSSTAAARTAGGPCRGGRRTGASGPGRPLSKRTATAGAVG